jgi:hypothetical protein
MHRTSTKKWCTFLDNQIQVSTALAGFSDLQITPQIESFLHWSKWRGVGIAMDGCSVGVSGVHALKYFFNCNLWEWPDPSHCLCRDWDDLLRQLGLWDFLLLKLIDWNALHGDNKDESRYNQLREALSTIYNKYTAASMPLFRELAPAMITQLEAGDIIIFPRIRPVEEELFEFLQSRAKFLRIGRRTSLCRFGGAIKKLHEEFPFWSVNEFEATTLALELDMLKGRKFLDKVTLKPGAAESIGVGSTCPTGIQLEDRTLRDCAGNAIVLRVMTLAEESHRQVCVQLAVLSMPFKTWHTSQNRDLRSVGKTEEWLIDQIANGGFTKHLQEFIGFLSDRGALVKCGYFVELNPKVINKYATRLVVEQEYANLFGQFIMTAVQCRIRRQLFLFGWPYRMIAVLKDEETAKATVALFKRDWSSYERLEALPGRSTAEQSLLTRNVCTLKSNLQLHLAVEEIQEDVLDMRFLALNRERARGNIATQLNEDFNGTMGNAKAMKQGRKFKRPERCMSVCIEKKIIDERHHYKTVKLDAPLQSLQARLPAAAFVPVAEKRSIPFQRIETTSQKAPYYSVATQNWHAPHADSYSLRQFNDDESMHNIDSLWLGQVCSVKHRIAIGIARSGTKTFDWYFALDHFHNSSVTVWPGTLHKLGPTLVWLEPSMDLSEPMLLPFANIDPKVVQCFTYEWQPWMWQVHTVPAPKRKALSPAIRAFADEHGVLSVAEVACWNCWWNIQCADLKRWAKVLEVEIPPGATLVDVLWALVKSILELGDEATLAIVHLRVAKLNDDVPHSEALLEIDAAIEVPQLTYIQIYIYIYIYTYMY